ncbi:zinc/cadmium/mercury/lead-transporting ATPase [Photobacterium sp. ZSDE20]|uniref:P-type Zn(2+) transporter n=1 Tax=Photobacterium pectinilyticum TaxID=2906793 RepID=A0ABT1N7D6_9GAMM|nr:zinc/cadmium/mercury/lead-transporting ATPase [Photobacterium sp. ZSDE20]MCQ1060660.1 zinc/cadmium/mercury/lead-transporting ATPase [Photobacterium sp. ZSDE20]MDD1828182.1 zinc/cadmium/mercury/lead-transporting ATPase [Photobacterium sp. ZSDE20]
MCAQCNNKKLHVHSVKAASVGQSSVVVENNNPEPCCTSSNCQSTQTPATSQESELSPGDDDPASGASSGFSVNKITSAEAAAESSCCSSGGCSSTASVEEQSDDTQSDDVSPAPHSTTISWKVGGMDCPSCASKLEKAINGLDGVVSAKVMFATEKLVVNCQSAEISDAIVAKSRETGFSLFSSGSSSEEGKPASLLKENLPVLMIAVMMLISFLVSRQSEAMGLAAFTATTLVGLLPIARKAINLAKSGSLFSIETLMSVAAIGALYLGETAEAAMVLLLFLIGEQLEGYASAKARSGVKSLMALVPEKASRILPDGSKEQVSASELQQGDVIEVAPGGRLPADVELLDAAASFDESALTGESVPVERLPGEQVMAGALVADKVVRLRIISEQGANAIDRILHLIEDAESRKAPLERFVDRFSRWYTPAMIVLAALVVVVPPMLFGQNWDEWLYKGLTLLLIACPCALVISIPAAITSGLAAATRRGALIKGGAALEQLGRIQTVAFDKTGTLTEGKPVMTDIVSWDGDEARLLRQSAAVEMGSAHPLAQAVVNAAKERGLQLEEAQERQALPGRGIQGNCDGDTLMLVAADRMPENVSLTAQQSEQAYGLEGEGKTLVVALRNLQPVGLIAWRDNLRADSAKAVQKLKEMGIHSVMLTGDNPRAAAAIAGEIGIAFEAGLLPEDKVQHVELANQRANVAMVGDGINDAPAMKTASIGIAMGGGTDVALETADAALTHNRVSELTMMIALSKATLANIKQNVFLALGLKGVFLITTLLGMTGLWVAVLADSGATALVTLNALRLLTFNYKE